MINAKKLALVLFIILDGSAYSSPVENNETDTTSTLKKHSPLNEVAPIHPTQKKISEEDEENALYGIFLFLLSVYWIH